MTVIETGLYDREGESKIEGRAVACTTLLNAAREQKLTSIECLKIDVEGIEDSVLMPCFREAPRALWLKAIVGEHIFTDLWCDHCLSRGYSQRLRNQYNIALTLE